MQDGCTVEEEKVLLCEDTPVNLYFSSPLTLIVQDLVPQFP